MTRTHVAHVGPCVASTVAVSWPEGAPGPWAVAVRPLATAPWRVLGESDAAEAEFALRPGSAVRDVRVQWQGEPGLPVTSVG